MHDIMTKTADIFNYVKSHVTILDVVQEYVHLKRAGSYWKGYSPFRSETAPSFTVSPEKGIYYCFSTNIGGDVIHFISQIENCSQYEAAQHLIDRYHLQPPDELTKTTEHDDKKQYHLACSLFATWCHNYLMQSQAAYRYLDNRGFTQQIITDFQIGYCPSQSILKNRFLPFAKKHGITHDDLRNANIIKQGHYGDYSPFEDRIIFPISNHLGHICGFGGRVFKANDQRAKYYNSQDHPYFRKGQLLYGLDKAKQHIQQHEHVYLVEGYTDCLAMVAAGYPNTVATLGTACSKEHLQLLARYAHKLYVLYDGDTAGQNALLRLTKFCWDVDLDLSVIPLAHDEDPATLLAEKQLASKLHQAYDIFQYYIACMGSSFLQKPLQERIHSVRNVFQTIVKIKDPLKKDLLLQQAAQTFDIPFETLYKEVSGQTKPTKQPIHKQQGKFLLEKCVIYVTLFNQDSFSDDDILMLKKFLPSPVNEIFSKIIAYHKQVASFVFDDFFATLNNEEQRIVSKIVMECEKYAHKTPPQTILQQFYKKKWKDLVSHVKAHAHTQDSTEYQQALNDFYALKNHIVRRGLVWQPKSSQ